MKRLKPYALLNRLHSPPRWELVGTYETMDQAQIAANKVIGAWKWWGPIEIAQKMIDDPSYEHPEEAAT